MQDLQCGPVRDLTRGALSGQRSSFVYVHYTVGDGVKRKTSGETLPNYGV